MVPKAFALVSLIASLMVFAAPESALADDARRLRLEAGALVQKAHKADSAQEAEALLKDAHGKLLEIRQHYPSESTRLTLYLRGRRVSLSPEDVLAMMAAAPFLNVEAGMLREVLGRQLSPTAVDENGWTDLHWAATLNLPELAKALLDAGADVAVRLKDDRRPLSDGLTDSLEELGLHSEFRRVGGTPLHWAASGNATEAAEALIAAGADIHTKDSDGRTPLDVAVSENSQAVLGGVAAAPTGSVETFGCPWCR